MPTSFFNGSFFNGEFFNTSSVVSPTASCYQRQIPGGAFVNEVGEDEAQIPGFQFINQTCVTETPTVVTSTGPGPAGKSTRGAKRKRKVLIGDRMYEVDSLKDVEFLLKRIVREDAEPVAQAAKGRIRVVDRVAAKLDAVEPVAIPVAAEVDWSSLWAQLALQDREYANVLERVLMRMEEDDLETILLTIH